MTIRNRPVPYARKEYITFTKVFQEEMLFFNIESRGCIARIGARFGFPCFCFRFRNKFLLSLEIACLKYITVQLAGGQQVTVQNAVSSSKYRPVPLLHTPTGYSSPAGTVGQGRGSSPCRSYFPPIFSNTLCSNLKNSFRFGMIMIDLFAIKIEYANGIRAPGVMFQNPLSIIRTRSFSYAFGRLVYLFDQEGVE